MGPWWQPRKEQCLKVIRDPQQTHDRVDADVGAPTAGIRDVVQAHLSKNSQVIGHEVIDPRSAKNGEVELAVEIPWDVQIHVDDTDASLKERHPPSARHEIVAKEEVCAPSNLCFRVCYKEEGRLKDHLQAPADRGGAMDIGDRIADLEEHRDKLDIGVPIRKNFDGIRTTGLHSQVPCSKLEPFFRMDGRF